MNYPMIEKLRFIESESVGKGNADVKPGHTSITITHYCGCVLTEHFATGMTMLADCPENETNNIKAAERNFYIEFCPIHKSEFTAQMQLREFFSLRNKALGIIREMTDDKDFRDFNTYFLNILNAVCKLPDRPAVVNTFKGIIGYYIWLRENNRPLRSFITDSIHDLIECVNHHTDEWYAPRTEQYVEFYNPEKDVKWNKNE